MTERPLKIGITCYPSVGGSGILASALGVELARRGHEVHFISYERPFRIPADVPGLFFHPVVVNDYALFKYPDYTLPLSVKMAEVCAQRGLDVLHVHYAVPHATAALLARAMLPPGQRPRIVTTLHGTDTTLLGRDAGYRPAIRYALEGSDAITVVSEWLRGETQRVLAVERPIDVIHNFFVPRPPSRSREAVREELGLRDEAMIVHLSNLRPLKRVEHLLEALARMRSREQCKLVVLAGGDFEPFRPLVRQLGLESRVLVRENVFGIEDYLQAADLGFFASEAESFCLGILEAMCFGCPSVATRVGGIPEVIEEEKSGLLVAVGDIDALAAGADRLVEDPGLRLALGGAGRRRAEELFSAAAIVPRYVDLYRRVCARPPAPL